MDNLKVLSKLKGGVIVSCQALEDEPLHSSFIMSKMAMAAKEGGAVGIRANSYDDIKCIKEAIDLPLIGIVKRVYSDSKVYITPTLKEIDEVINAGADIIAVDATSRIRPKGDILENFYTIIRERYPDKIFMADISNFEEGVKAEKLGFDLISTTLSGYTEYTKDSKLPNYKLLASLVNNLHTPVIAEGGIWTPEELKIVMDLGAFAAVIGTAITRPREITKRFVSIIK